MLWRVRPSALGSGGGEAGGGRKGFDAHGPIGAAAFHRGGAMPAPRRAGRDRRASACEFADC
eukprot:366472-Chlamydomonas_euryale.AAC.13